MGLAIAAIGIYSALVLFLAGLLISALLEKDNKKLRYTYDLFDKYDAETKTHSMARTTGYTATVVLRMLADGLYNEKGIIVPEYIGKKPECVEYILKGLAERRVNYTLNVEEL